MGTNITKLVNYNPSSYPNLPGADAQWFTREFAAIRAAINSIEVILKAGSTGVTIKSGLPTTTDLPPGAAGDFKDSSGGGVYHAYNDGGTIKKVALT